MEVNILSEVSGVSYNQVIYCYVEEQNASLDEFISKYDESSIIHIVTSVVESCEGQLLYCLCDILTNYIEASKEQDSGFWFVTDVKGLYDIVEKLFPSLFEEIIYVGKGNSAEFDSGLETDQLASYFINIQRSKLNASFMRKLWNLKSNGSIENFMEFLYELGDFGIEKEQILTKLWCCFCEILVYETECNNSADADFNYKLAVYSILMVLGKKASYINAYLNEVLENSKTKAGSMYFVWNQFKRMSLKKLAVFDNKSSQLCDELYNRSYNGFESELKEYFVKIPLEERDKNLVLISTIQFLDETHAPTRTVIERAKALKHLGKTVIIINTAEQYTMKNYLPMYSAGFGRVLEKYNNVNELKIGNDRFPFIQMPEQSSIQYRMEIMIKLLQKYKPYYILSIGTGSMLADLCGNIVPCASMALAFSTFPKTMNKMKILGRNLYKEEKSLYIEDDIIESRFTFELKPQKGIFSREYKGLPEDRFILVVVGIRLEFEVTDAFMDMLEEVCSQGCYVVFAGIMDNYNKLMESYPVVSANSLFIGYCDDMLALMDICDLYVNPERLGGGFSIIEAFVKGKPGVYLKSGDVYTAGGESFAVDSFKEMAEQILKYKEDKDYYNSMSGLARERAKLMTSSEEAIADIDRQICERVESKYW